MHSGPRMSGSLLMERDTVAVFMSGDDQQLSIVVHHLNWTPPLILTVYSRLNRGIQSATEMLPLFWLKFLFLNRSL